MKKCLFVVLTILLGYSGGAGAFGITLPNGDNFPGLTIEGAWLPVSSFQLGDGNSINSNNASFLLGATMGLGNGFAVQGRAMNINVPQFTAKDGSLLSAEGIISEFNLMYKIDRCVAVYVGATYTEGKMKNYEPGGADMSLGTVGAQIGGMVDVPVFRGLSGFLDYSLGNQLSQFSIGAEYNLIGLGTVNLGYYIMQQYSVDYQGKSVSYNLSGPLLGLSFGI